MNAVTTIAPSRLPIAPSVAKEFDIQPTQWRVLVEQIFPNAKTVEAVTMALSYCRARNLDIYKKPVHVVPMWSSALNKMVETVWPGIAEIRTTASRTGEYAGIDEVIFGPMVERTFRGTTGKGQYEQQIEKTVRFPEWASVVVYRWVKGQKASFHTKVFWEETYASIGKSDVPNDMWARRSRGQLDKCVEAAALRKAFPEEVGSLYAAEEMEGRVIDHDIVDKPAVTPTPPKPPVPPQVITARSAHQSDGSTSHATLQDDIVDADVIDAETGEVVDEREVVKETGEQTAALMDGDDDTIGDYFERMNTAMAEADDAASIAEIWNDMDPLAKFEGDEESQALATSIKRRHVQRVGQKNG